MNNVITFERSAQTHTAIRHVLGLALEKAVSNGALSVQRAKELTERAPRYDCGEMRQLVEWVLHVWQQKRKELVHAKG